MIFESHFKQTNIQDYKNSLIILFNSSISVNGRVSIKNPVVRYTWPQVMYWSSSLACCYSCRLPCTVLLHVFWTTTLPSSLLILYTIEAVAEHFSPRRFLKSFKHSSNASKQHLSLHCCKSKRLWASSVQCRIPACIVGKLLVSRSDRSELFCSRWEKIWTLATTAPQTHC